MMWVPNHPGTEQSSMIANLLYAVTANPVVEDRKTPGNTQSWS